MSLEHNHHVAVEVEDVDEKRCHQAKQTKGTRLLRLLACHQQMAKLAAWLGPSVSGLCTEFGVRSQRFFQTTSGAYRYLDHDGVLIA